MLLQFDPYWRPGAVPRSFFKVQSPKTYSATESTKIRKKGQKNVKKTESEENVNHEMKSMFVVQQKDGQIQVMFKELKPIKNRHVSEYPYVEDVLPYTIKVQGEKDDQAKRKKQTKAKEIAVHREGVCRDAFANICRRLYHKVDKETLHAAAAEQEQCPCLFLQAQIINNLVEMFMDKQESSSKKEAVPDTFLNQLMKSILEGEHTVGGCPSKDSISSEEDWRVEFTPPFARYNPRAKRLITKNIEVQTVRPKTEEDGPMRVTVTVPHGTDTPTF